MAFANTWPELPAWPDRCAMTWPSASSRKLKPPAELHDLIKDAIVRARDIARGIAPVHVDEAGLTSGLEELAVNTVKLHGIYCRFHSDGEILVRNRQMAIHLYRIAQEATANAIRHGKATSVVDFLVLQNRADGAAPWRITAPGCRSRSPLATAWACAACATAPKSCTAP